MRNNYNNDANNIESIMLAGGAIASIPTSAVYCTYLAKMMTAEGVIQQFVLMYRPE